MWKQPVADGRATVGAESEPERANALADVDKRELSSLGALPPCRSAFDDVARGDTAVVEPTTDLRIVDRCLYGRDVRRPEWMQRDNGIRKRRIGWAQLHRAGSYGLTFTSDQRRRDDYAGFRQIERPRSRRRPHGRAARARRPPREERGRPLRS